MLAVMAVLLGACGAPLATTPIVDVPFTEHATSAQSAHAGPDPLVIVAADARGQAELGRLVQGLRPVADDHVLVAAFQGQQRTGGFAIRIRSIVRGDNVLEVHAGFEVPPPDAITIQVITSPVHVVSIKRDATVSGIVQVRLWDTDRKLRASASAKL